MRIARALLDLFAVTAGLAGFLALATGGAATLFPGALG